MRPILTHAWSLTPRRVHALANRLRREQEG
jgi:hypothetical protein